MIVIDASAVLDLLLQRQGSEPLAQRLETSMDVLHAPHLIDIEVASALRRQHAAGNLSERRCNAAIADLADMPIARHSHRILLNRIWELRNNLTAYDAAYIALAEALDATLITRDAAIASARHRAHVEVF